MPKKASKASKRTVVAAEKRLEALDLRIGGADYRQIAKRQGCAVSMAYKRVIQALEDLQEHTRERAEQLRQVQMLRLEKLWLQLYGQPRDHLNARALLAVLDRQAKLHGLDAPSKLSVLTPEQWSELEERATAGDEVALAELQRLAAGG